MKTMIVDVDDKHLDQTNQTTTPSLTIQTNLIISSTSMRFATQQSHSNETNQTVNDGVDHSKNPRKCSYHMTFDLNLEHTLDAGLPGYHRVQVWSRSSHLPGRRSNFRASTKVPVSRDLWPWAHPGCTLTWSPSCESMVAIRPFVCETKRFAQTDS